MLTKNITESCSSTTKVLHTQMVGRQLHGSAPNGTPLARPGRCTPRWLAATTWTLPVVCLSQRYPDRTTHDNYTVVPPKVPQPRGREATGGLAIAIWLLADHLYHRGTSLWPIGYRHWHLQSQRHRKQAAQQYIRGDTLYHRGNAPDGCNNNA